MYNETSSLWACCQVGDRKDCTNPGNETFYAPAPKDLRSISSTSTYSTSKTSVSSSPTTKTTSSSQLSVPSQTTTIITTTESHSSSTNCAESQTCSSGLSNGTKIGIGIGSALGGLAILIGSLFLMLLYLRRPKKADEHVDAVAGNFHRENPPPPPSEADGSSMAQEAYGYGVSELSTIKR